MTPLLRTPFIVFGANVLLWTVQSQLNHYTAPSQLSVFLGGLCVTFPALRLSYRDGVRALVLTGFWFDAASPVPFGLHTLLFLFCHTVLHGVRGRLARDETLVGLGCAALCNLVLFLALSFALLHRGPEPLAIIPRLIADSLVSFGILAVVGAWFFALVEHSLEYCGAGLRREQRGIV